jgi:hypothetical protein
MREKEGDEEEREKKEPSAMVTFSNSQSSPSTEDDSDRTKGEEELLNVDPEGRRSSKEENSNFPEERKTKEKVNGCDEGTTPAMVSKEEEEKERREPSEEKRRGMPRPSVESNKMEIEVKERETLFETAIPVTFSKEESIEI